MPTPAKELVYFPSWTAGRKGYAERMRQLFAEFLLRRGLRLTPQRERILNFLLQADRHLDQAEIYQSLRRHGIGRVTVFRMLKLLEQSKLAEAVTSPDGPPRFEIKLERPHHDHLICVHCGRIKEIQWPEVEKIQERACRKVGFSPVWHRHEIFGRCAQCAASARKEGA